MGTGLPVVSVLMTAYNRDKYIAEAIESVLTSIYKDFELIIVDDGSTDTTVAIARQYEAKDTRIKVYINENNLGDYPNRNKAATYAKGRYIKYHDSDDIMYPHCLEVMVGSMEKFPEAGFGLSAKSDSLVPYPVSIPPRQIYLEHFHDYGHFDRAPGSGIIRRDVFEKVGGFSGKRHIGDTELWFTIAQRHNMVKFPGDLYWSRIHTNSEGAIEKRINLTKMRKELVQSFLYSELCPIDPKESKSSLTKQIKQSIGRFI